MINMSGIEAIKNNVLVSAETSENGSQALTDVTADLTFDDVTESQQIVFDNSSDAAERVINYGVSIDESKQNIINKTHSALVALNFLDDNERVKTLSYKDKKDVSRNYKSIGSFLSQNAGRLGTAKGTLQSAWNAFSAVKKAYDSSKALSLLDRLGVTKLRSVGNAKAEYNNKKQTLITDVLPQTVDGKLVTIDNFVNAALTMETKDFNDYKKKIIDSIEGRDVTYKRNIETSEILNALSMFEDCKDETTKNLIKMIKNRMKA